MNKAITAPNTFNAIAFRCFAGFGDISFAPHSFIKQISKYSCLEKIRRFYITVILLHKKLVLKNMEGMEVLGPLKRGR